MSHSHDSHGETPTKSVFASNIETLYNAGDELLQLCARFSKAAALEGNMEAVSEYEAIAAAQYEVLKKIALAFPSPEKSGGCGSGGCGGCTGCGV